MKQKAYSYIKDGMITIGFMVLATLISCVFFSNIEDNDNDSTDI